MPENRVRTCTVGATVSTRLTCAGRSAAAWISPPTSSARPTTTNPRVTSPVRERILCGAIGGRSGTLVTRCARARGDQHWMFHQVAGEHRAAGAFGDQRLLAVRIGAAKSVHALGIVVGAALDQEG